MKETDVAVLGGLSGNTAGIGSRRYYPDRKVLLITKEGIVLVPCGILSICGTVGDSENGVMPDGPLEHNGIELLKGEAVIFAVFVVAHICLVITGHTLLADVIAMFTAYAEKEEH